MQESIQSVLNQVLTIINYPDDKQAFILDFGDMCISQTLALETKSFPLEKQNELLNRIKDLADPKEAEEIIAQYIPIENYRNSLEHVSGELFEEFLLTIEPDLTDEQIDALDRYIASLEHNYR